MATTVDQLIVEIKAETKGLKTGLNEVNQKLGTMDKRVKSSIISFGTLAKGLAVIGLARVGGEIVNTSRTFEDLGATLKAITGSQESAAAGFDLIRKFTAGTTFQLENVSSAFITLLNAGITPTSDTLMDFGNVAAAFNKDITQLAQAAFNATTGEMEMLKQFGIVARLEGDKINVTFDGVTKQIDRNATDIIDFIRSIGAEKFPTALEERANTVTGAFSNLADATSELFNAMGEAGLNEVLVRSTRKLIDLVNAAKPLGRLVGATLKTAFEKLKEAIALVNENLSFLITLVGSFIALKLAVTVVRTGIAFVNLVRALKMARVAMIAFNMATKGNFLIIVALGIAQITGGLEALTKKLDSVIKKFGEDGGLKGILGDLADDKSLEELDQIFKDSLGDDGVLPEATDNVKKLDEATADLTESIVNSSHAFTREFVDALLEGEDALQSLNNLARDIVSEIISHFLRLAVINPILNNIFGGTAGFTNLPVSGGTGGGGNIPQVGANAGGSGLASGGTVQSRTAYLVGERGAEIFVPNTGGTMLNNMNTRNALGGNDAVVVNQTINLSTGVVPTVRAELIKMMPQISEATKGAVLESALRGGSFRRGLQGG